MQTERRQLEQLSRAECVRLLGTATVGRFIFTIGGLPAVEPVTFIVDDRGIVFRTRDSSRLVATRTNTIVGFEVDQLDSTTHTGWSVTVVGEAYLLDETDASSYGSSSLRAWEDGPLSGSEIIVVRLGMVTGRRIVA